MFSLESTLTRTCTHKGKQRDCKGAQIYTPARDEGQKSSSGREKWSRDCCWTWIPSRARQPRPPASSLSRVSSLRLRSARLPLRGGLHRRVRLVQQPRPEAAGTQQHLGPAYVRLCHLLHGGPEGPAAGPEPLPRCEAGSLHFIHLHVGVQLGRGAEPAGGLSVGLLSPSLQSSRTGDSGLCPSLGCCWIYSGAACNQEYAKDKIKKRLISWLP